MTAAEEKRHYVQKFTSLVGYGHEDRFKRLPSKTLKTLIDKIALASPAPVGG